ncbi:hypothetical protein LCGC14_1025380 [marine sediment metagenome]|uniref:Phage conserved hypothetical protein C-terminal domain-containing protein n=1 Tax=marine sediment metagenome TaxID=412755 RepID=A0A0F9NHU8_9ZZZZ
MNAIERRKQERIQICAEAIKHLNEKADRLFKPDTRAILMLFTAEWSHQYGIKQYKGVIDYLVLKWKGNPEMEQYLRPATIFGPEKFPEYLAEARSLIYHQIRKNRLIPFIKYSPVHRSELNSLTAFKNYDPHG